MHHSTATYLRLSQLRKNYSTTLRIRRVIKSPWVSYQAFREAQSGEHATREGVAHRKLYSFLTR